MKKNIYIIGGLGLIGFELVKQLISKDNNIIVIDKFKKIKKQKYVKYINLDITKIQTLQVKLKKLFVTYGKPHSMVNCSYPKTSNWKNNDFKRINYSNYSKNISLHLNTYIWITKIFSDEMIKNKFKYPSIVLLSSIYGFLGQNLNIYKNEKIRENLTYSVIKGGIINAVRSFSSYYGNKGLWINCVSPGGVLDNQSKSFLKKYNREVPMNRMAFKHEVANVIKFLISEKSSYITGQNIIVDGGYSII